MARSVSSLSRLSLVYKIRLVFISLVCFATFVIFRTYIRQESALVFLDTYNTLLISTSYDYDLDQPSNHKNNSTARTTVTNSNHTDNALFFQLRSSSSSSAISKRKNTYSASYVEDNNISTTTKLVPEAEAVGIKGEISSDSFGTIKEQNNNNNNGTTNNGFGISSSSPPSSTSSSMSISMLPQQQEKQQDVLVSLPDDSNTAIVLVAMGFSSDSNTTSNNWLVERCVRSIRTGGRFHGYIVVITDREGYKKYSTTLPQISSYSTNNNNNHKVIVLESKMKDRIPKMKNGKTIRHLQKRTRMLYKRYKTLILQYMTYAAAALGSNRSTGITDTTTTTTNTEEQHASAIEHVLYLDVDNVVARPLSTFFEDYYTSITNQLFLEDNSYAAAAAAIHTTSNTIMMNNNSIRKRPEEETSFFSFWKDPHVRHKGIHLWQSGQIMLSTKYSNYCLGLWRQEMDDKKHVMDQALLLNVYIRQIKLQQQQYNSSNITTTERHNNPHPHRRCLFFELPNNRTSDIAANNRNSGVGVEVVAVGGGSNDDDDVSENNNNSDDTVVDQKEQYKSKKHFELLSRDITSIANVNDYPTIVHLTKARLDRLSRRQHEYFLRRSLHLDDDSNNRTISTTRNEKQNGGKSDGAVRILSKTKKNQDALSIHNDDNDIDYGNDSNYTIENNGGIIWNNKTISWNEIIHSFDDDVGRKKKTG